MKISRITKRKNSSDNPNYGKWCQYFRLGFQNNIHQNWPTVFRFIHWFLPADVANPILGINFFKQHGLVISPPTHQIVFSGSGIPLWPANLVSSSPTQLQWPGPATAAPSCLHIRSVGHHRCRSLPGAPPLQLPPR